MQTAAQSSRSCGLLDDFEEIMDGVVAAERGIPGKPAPDTFIAAAKDLGADAATSLSSSKTRSPASQAGRDGGFGYRGRCQPSRAAREACCEHGATIVVDDL